MLHTLVAKNYLPNGSILHLHDGFGNELEFRAKVDVEKYGERVEWLYPGQQGYSTHPTYLAYTCFRMVNCMPGVNVVGAKYWHLHSGSISISLYDLWTRYLREGERILVMEKVHFKIEIDYDEEYDIFIATASEEFKGDRRPVGRGTTYEEALRNFRISLNIQGGYVWPILIR